MWNFSKLFYFLCPFWRIHLCLHTYMCVYIDNDWICQVVLTITCSVVRHSSTCADYHLLVSSLFFTYFSGSEGFCFFFPQLHLIHVKFMHFLKLKNRVSISGDKMKLSMEFIFPN